MNCDFVSLFLPRHSLPAVICSRHAARRVEPPRAPPAPCGNGCDERWRVVCDGRYAGRFLHSARSCLARSGRNDGCERGNDGCE
ncbi:MAG: hypothetical protein LBO71_03640 [Prevotellaceae bacterium]|nr:hypothetical protein [Prevotellaceae bacterium]